MMPNNDDLLFEYDSSQLTRADGECRDQLLQNRRDALALAYPPEQYDVCPGEDESPFGYACALCGGTGYILKEQNPGSPQVKESL